MVAAEEAAVVEMVCHRGQRSCWSWVDGLEKDLLFDFEHYGDG